MVLDRFEEVAWLSLRNVPTIHVLAVDQLNAYDVLVADSVVFTSAALAAFTHRGAEAVASESEATEPAGPRKPWRTRRRSERTEDPRPPRRHPAPRRQREELQPPRREQVHVRRGPRANKTEIKIAIEKIFDVRVIAVNTQNRQGKRRRTRFGIGKRVDVKRAIVTVAEGDRIDIFAGQGE